MEMSGSVLILQISLVSGLIEDSGGPMPASVFSQLREQVAALENSSVHA